MSALHAFDSTAAQAAPTLEALKRRPTLTVAEAAAVLGIGRNACYEAIHRGEIEHLKFGSRIVVKTRPLLRQLGIEDA